MATEHMLIGDQIVAAARACLGTPFHHLGRVPGVGLDCLGLVLHSAVSVGKPLTSPKAYPRDPSHVNMLAGAAANPALARVSNLAEIRAGDVLLLQICSKIRHLAIYTGETLIHVLDGSVNRVCEHAIDSRWRRRMVAAYRFVEEEA